MIVHALAILALGAPAPQPATPHAIVQALYAPYVAADARGRAQAPSLSAVDSIRHFAAPGLKKLITADDDCQKREEGICNIDFDFLIAGQDWDPLKLSITDDPAAGNRQIVHARFDNGGPVEVRFYFVKQGGAWRIDDVEDLRPKDDPIRRDIWLKRQLQGK
jgi:hypothetical protein